MTTHGFSGNEGRVWRAVVFALAVVAQLVMPAIAMRAEAMAAAICTLPGDDDSGSTKGHAHQQQCAHCRVHDCFALTPPTVRSMAAPRTSVAEPAVAMSFSALPGRRAQPPPTGPPAA